MNYSEHFPILAQKFKHVFIKILSKLQKQPGFVNQILGSSGGLLSFTKMTDACALWKIGWDLTTDE